VAGGGGGGSMGSCLCWGGGGSPGGGERRGAALRGVGCGRGSGGRREAGSVGSPAEPGGVVEAMVAAVPSVRVVSRSKGVSLTGPYVPRTLSQMSKWGYCGST
jgi:hypothetical protein